jgi:methionine synthase II (cobalamin-independent)
MTKISVSLHGVFPRPENVVRAWQDYERGRAPRAVPEKLEGPVLDEYVRLQNRLGCDPVVFPMNAWLDLFRPFTEIVDGLTPGALTRFFETNTFYRAPVRTHSLRLREERLQTWLETYLPPADTPRGVKYVLPSPYFFAAAMDGGRCSEEGICEIGDIVWAVIGAVKERHKSLQPPVIQLQDPFIGVYGAENESAVTALSEWLRRISRELGLEVLLHTYFGGSRETLEVLLRLPVAAVGIDASAFAPERLAEMAWNSEVSLYLGLQEVRTTQRFADDLLRSYIDAVIGTWGPPEVILSFNGDPEFLPADIFVDKLEQLARLREEYE